MQTNKPLIRANPSTLEVIRRELGEDPKVLESQIKSFQEWLRSQRHLPNDADERIIENFVSLSLCDLGKAKEKFERYLLMRTKLKDFYQGKVLDEDYFKASNVQRYIIPYPEVAPEGYRFGIIQVPKDPNQMHFDYFFHYGLMIIDYLLLEDTSAGYKGIYDMSNLTPQHFAKINLRQLVQLVELMHVVCPFIFKEMHFLNVPPLPPGLLDFLNEIFGEKLRPMIHLHQDPGELTAYIREEMLPEDFGGGGKSMAEMGENNRQFFVRDKEWLGRFENLELTGDVPPKKSGSFLYDDPRIESFKNM